jgi:hypothetical protein
MECIALTIAGSNAAAKVPWARNSGRGGRAKGAKWPTITMSAAHQSAGIRRTADVALESFLPARVRGRAARDVAGVYDMTNGPVGTAQNPDVFFQDAGADALELNLYRVAADWRRTAAEMESADLELIAAVRASVTIPLAVKPSPYDSALANFAAEVSASGADGLVLFNRFCQPDLDLESLEVVPRLNLSQSWEMRLPVRWIAILRPQLGPGVSLAATSGAHTGTDVIKGLMQTLRSWVAPEHLARALTQAPATLARAAWIAS